MGGTAALWTEEGRPRQAVDIINHYYSPKLLKMNLINELGRPVGIAKVTVGAKEAYSDHDGSFEIPYYSDKGLKVLIEANSYVKEEIDLSDIDYIELVLIKSDPNIIFRIRKFLYNLLN